MLKLSLTISLVVFDMLRLSVNLLSNALSYLREIDSYAKSSVHEPMAYYQAFSVSAEAIIDIANTCKWISTDESHPVLTNRGKKIMACGSYGLPQASIRMMLEDYLYQVRPIWRNRIPFGRQEASIFMSKDERACFYEAGLLSESPSSSVVNWWDQVSAKIRNERETSNLSTGRLGERLTLLFEKKRTNGNPRWMAIESNKLGYDILSQVSASDKTSVLIEVKASTESIDNAYFYISKNEWNVANGTSCYYFYLWHISTNHKKIAILTPDRVARYIPINQQNGEWESVRIPYGEFSSDFKEIV